MPANIKIVRSDLGSTGMALVMDVQRVVDGFWYDFADGEFRAIAATQNVVVTEVAYRYSGSTLAIGTAWNDGSYIFRFKTAVTFIPVAADIQEILNDNLDSDIINLGIVTTAITAAEVLLEGAGSRDLTEVYNLVAGISAGPQVSIEVPEKLIRPVAGNTIYRINVNIYDSAGNPEAPDVAPTIKIMTRDEVTTRVVETNMTQVVGQVGQYYYDYTVTSATTLEKESVIIKIIEGGVTTYHREITEIYMEGTSGSGTGSVVVDHNYGAVDAYRILRIITGAAVEGAGLYMFTQADWNAGNRDLRSVHDGGNCRGQSSTGSDGRWLTPIALDPDTYVLFISDPLGEYVDYPVTINVI